MMQIENKLTVLVNSCDAYEDVWDPFFFLFKEYGGILKKCNIVINTESKTYKYPDLNIVSYSLFKNNKPNWGERLRRTLEKIPTEYVITFMEDFFLVDNVDNNMIESIIDWMDKDKTAGAFHLLPLDEVEEIRGIYPNFCEVKPGTPYRCNTQVCIWRKNVLYRSILDKESPWIWEDIGRLRNDVLLVSKIYSLSWNAPKPIDYNFYVYERKNEINRTYCHSGIIKGKWNLEVVEKLFKNNDINVDYKIRGVYRQSFKNKIKCNWLLKKMIFVPYKFFSKMIFIKSSLDNKNKWNEYISEYVTPYLKYEKF